MISSFTVLYCTNESNKRLRAIDKQETYFNPCKAKANASSSLSKSGVPHFKTNTSMPAPLSGAPRFIYGSDGSPIVEYNYRWNKYEKYS